MKNELSDKINEKKSVKLDIDPEIIRKWREESIFDELDHWFLECGIAPNMIHLARKYYSPLDGKMYIPGQKPYTLRKIRFP